MAKFSHTYRAPFRFLEDGETEERGNACSPLTICDADNNDLANIYSRDDSTVSTTREEAIAVARLFAAAPNLLLALRTIGEWPVSHPENQDAVNMALVARRALTALEG